VLVLKKVRRGVYMAEGRCMKCRKQVEIKDAVESRTANGLRILKGVCPTCETKVCRILGK
jgi:hypothetical protein